MALARARQPLRVTLIGSQSMEGKGMWLWRVSPVTDLARSCQAAKAGRWSWASRQVLYTSMTPELAALEALAHREEGDGPYWLCRVELPEGVMPKRVERLPTDWRENKTWSRAFGNRWCDQLQSAALQVPSALCEEAANVLVNPLHPDARGLGLTAMRQFRFDRRLLKR